MNKAILELVAIFIYVSKDLKNEIDMYNMKTDTTDQLQGKLTSLGVSTIIVTVISFIKKK